MVNRTILKPEIQQFISDNIKNEVSQLAFQKNIFPDIEWKEILNQIAAKQKAKDKLPTWFTTLNIIYPSKISVEQTSSEKTAQYKANLVSGKNLIDLSGGFGVDDYYFSKKVNQVIHCEINAELSEIVKHNFKNLGVQNVNCFAEDSIKVLESLNQKFDWIYIDPSRRNDVKGKVFMLKDCSPNVPELLDFYFNYTDSILVKTAPILDISAGLSELKNVKEIHIVAIENEVKELLWIIKKDYKGSVEIKTCNIQKDNAQHFSINTAANYDDVSYGKPKTYLFEPNSAIMKSGAFDYVAAYFCINKLHQNSHLYTSDKLIDFPGRIFEIQNIIPYQKAEMKTFLENKKANITTRNFTDSVENIRKKWKIKDGGNLYCFFTTDINNTKIVILCNKLK